MNAMKLFLVLVGGALGTGCRYGLSSLTNSFIEKPTFPYANLLINVSGSFVLGILAELFAGPRAAPAAARASICCHAGGAADRLGLVGLLLAPAGVVA